MSLTSWGEQVGQAAREVVCSVLSVNESLAGFSDALFGVNWSASQAAAIRRGFCSNPDPAPNPGDFSPFQGGQCPGTLYEVTHQAFAGGSLIGSPATSNTYGPVTLSREVNSVGNTEARLYGYQIPNVGPGSNFQQTLQQVGGPSADTTIVVQSLTPLSGPDNCGNPPSELPPYAPITVNKSVTYEDNSNTQITENYDFTVNIPVIVGGILIAPVTIAGNDFTIELGVQLGGVEFNFGQPRGSDVDTDVPLPSDADEVPENSESERRIIGVLVTATVNEALWSGTTIAQDNGVPVRVPRLGLVSFVASISEDKVGYSADIDVKNDRQYIPCPFPQGAISVLGNPQTGVTWQLTRVYSSFGNLRS